MDGGKHVHPKESKLGGETNSSINDADAATMVGEKPSNEGMGMGMDATTGVGGKSTNETEKESAPSKSLSFCVVLFGLCPFAFLRKQSGSHEQSSEQQMSEDGMFYCSLCEVEVSKAFSNSYGVHFC